jgi:hypothetical protein
VHIPLYSFLSFKQVAQVFLVFLTSWCSQWSLCYWIASFLFNWYGARDLWLEVVNRSITVYHQTSS